ncbi:MAG: class I SAM-dependent methyltransferase [Lentisphaeria bacterium]|nr:class I SAM-dependent methyltransferase [Lentisphaeria bacterium]
MKRIRTKEIHEKKWCPDLFRDILTEFLSIIWAVGVYKQAIDEINLLIHVLPVKKIVDLCSGAGDYLPELLKEIQSEEKDSPVIIYKTDLFPNKRFFDTGNSHIRYFEEPLPADRAFSRFDALFCMFSALHHFDEPDLLKIFSRAARNGKSFAFFDVSQRRFFTDILPNIFLPPTLLCSAPFFKDFSWKHFLFIYVLPILPLIIFIDGTISRMRAYKHNELEALLVRVRKRYPDYHVMVTEYNLMGGLQKITAVLGYPREYRERISLLEEKKKEEREEERKKRKTQDRK